MEIEVGKTYSKYSTDWVSLLGEKTFTKQKENLHAIKALCIFMIFGNGNEKLF